MPLKLDGWIVRIQRGYKVREFVLRPGPNPPDVIQAGCRIASGLRWKSRYSAIRLSRMSVTSGTVSRFDDNMFAVHQLPEGLDLLTGEVTGLPAGPKGLGEGGDVPFDQVVDL
ncbi:uncharacterized protein AB9X84_025434 isoform 2-T5 [Acanthopagrus schlegelii]